MDSWVSILLGFLELVSLGTMNKRAKVDAEPVSISMPVAILVAAFTGCVLSVCFLAFLSVSALLG